MSRTDDSAHPFSGAAANEPPPAVAPFDAQKAKEHQEAWAKHLGVPVERTNSIGMKLVLIPPGEFMMGSPKEWIEEELKAYTNTEVWKMLALSEGPQHRVRITKPFYLGVMAVTQEEYQRVMGYNPSWFCTTGAGKDLVEGYETKRFPVEHVSWNEAVEFCRKLSNLPEEELAGRTYRLPSDAQREYSCRAGSVGRYGFGSGRSGIPREHEEHDLPDYAWFSGNSGGRTHAVGGKRASAWGLYDMHGNVWEWCNDWFDKDYYANSATDDPAGPLTGSYRVARGGSWAYGSPNCTSVCRNLGGPEFGCFQYGFRVSLVLADTAAERGTRSRSDDSAHPFSGAAANEPPPAVAPFDAQKAKEHQEAWAKHLGVPSELNNSIGMNFRLIPPGEFTMGSPTELIEDELKDPSTSAWFLPSEGPQHRVRITKPFFLATDPVTQEEYQRVTGSNPSYFCATGRGKDIVEGQDTKRYPVEEVSWDDAVEFCRKLSAVPEEKAAGRRYCLPSEAQWEYACRAGSTGRFSFSSGRNEIPKTVDETELLNYAWFAGNAGGRTHAVGRKRPNAWGLCDMHGNVWQWCQDWWDMDYYAKSGSEDPTGPGSGSLRVHRGGDFSSGFCRSAIRDPREPAFRNANLGFRVALLVADTAAERAKTTRNTTVAPPPADASGQRPVPAAATVLSPYRKPLPAVGSLIGPDGKWKLPPGAPSPAIAPFDEANAKEHETAWAKHVGAPVEISNAIGMKLRLIPPGEFTMGARRRIGTKRN